MQGERAARAARAKGMISGSEAKALPDEGPMIHESMDLAENGRDSHEILVNLFLLGFRCRFSFQFVCLLLPSFRLQKASIVLELRFAGKAVWSKDPHRTFNIIQSTFHRHTNIDIFLYIS